MFNRSRLPSDRRRKVGVDGSRQAIVEVLSWCQGSTAEVDGLHHATSCENTQHCVEVRIVAYDRSIQRLSQRLA